ncbi:MAG: alcohol dehydrogenase catalytic domain-containing protein [Syntrophales bacterium]|nr:alcohol dehydrogenase catalytic domain-containing protein [Syntrophales bacterium]
MATMRAVVHDEELRFTSAYPVPPMRPGWARIRVKLAGICRTDLELLKGYRNFRGILGHEFVGVVDECEDPSWLGRRVVGEINVACGRCSFCTQALERHCAQRLTLGINGLDGCMADYCLLPLDNLFALPDYVNDERAVFMEPLSAAAEILEQLNLSGREKALVIGDGKLGILTAWVLMTALRDVTLVGHHEEKLRRGQWRGIKTVLANEEIKPGADLVVEATGSSRGIEQAMRLCRPRGTIVLKTTVTDPVAINLTPAVVNEQTIVGSRCGRFAEGIRIMGEYPDMPIEGLISYRFPIEQATAAFAAAKDSRTLKVLLDMG